MTAMVPDQDQIQQTAYPHVVKRADTRGGEPIVAGTSLAVRHVLRLYRELGRAPASIARDYGLTEAQVHGALSYALDHPEEIASFEDANKIRSVMREQDLVLVGDRLIPRRRLDARTIPDGTNVYTWETLPDELER